MTDKQAGGLIDAVAIGAIAVLFVILSLPGDLVMALENWIKSLINLPQRPPSPSWFPTDKVVHVLLFLATALPVTLAITARARQRQQHSNATPASVPESHQKVPLEKRRLRLDQVGTTAFVIMLILGILSEWIQSFVPGRSADPLDLLADLLGSILGIVLAQLWAYPRRKPE